MAGDPRHTVACLLPEQQRRELWSALQAGATPDAARDEAGVAGEGAPVVIEGKEAG